MRKIDFELAERIRSARRLAAQWGGALSARRAYINPIIRMAFTRPLRDAKRLRMTSLRAKKFGFNFLRIHIKIDDPAAALLGG